MTGRRWRLLALLASAVVAVVIEIVLAALAKPVADHVSPWLWLIVIMVALKFGSDVIQEKLVQRPGRALVEKIAARGNRYIFRQGDHWVSYFFELGHEYPNFSTLFTVVLLIFLIFGLSPLQMLGLNPIHIDAMIRIFLVILIMILLAFGVLLIYWFGSDPRAYLSISSDGVTFKGKEREGNRVSFKVSWNDAIDFCVTERSLRLLNWRYRLGYQAGQLLAGGTATPPWEGFWLAADLPPCSDLLIDGPLSDRKDPQDNRNNVRMICNLTEVGIDEDKVKRALNHYRPQGPKNPS